MSKAAKWFAVLFSGVLILFSLLFFVLFNDYTKHVIPSSQYFNAAAQAHNDGNLVEATANYYQALFVAPRDTQTRALLEELSTHTNTLPPSHENLAVQLAATTSYLLNLHELAYIVWFAFLANSFLLTIRSIAIKKIFLLASFVLTLVLAILLAARFYQHAYAPLAVVATPNTLVYTGPDESYFQLFTLNSTQLVYVDTQLDGWAKIQVSPYRLGWIRRDALRWLERQP